MSACAVLALAAHAFADGARVVLVGAGSDPTVARMRQELGVLGFEVEQVPVERAGGSVAAIGQGRHAAAVARVNDAPPSVTLWFDVAAPGAGVAPGPAELTVDAELAGSTEPALLALRAVELVRGRLLPVPAPSASASSSAAPPAVVAPASAAQPPPRAPPPRPVATAAPSGPRGPGPRDPSFFVDGCVLASPGGVPPQPEVLVGGRARVTERIEIEALLLAPTTGASVSVPHGSVALRPAAVALGAALELTPPRGGVYVTAGVGAGLALLVFSGDAAPPYVAVSGARAAVFPHAHVAAGVALGRHLALRMDLLGALLRPTPVLRVAGEEVASFGEPALGAAIGLEVRP